jgi:alpha-methylacyl-CoA racemase
MNSNLPLHNIKVLEFEGLAPTVFCGMVLSDFGSDVTIISKPKKGFLVPDTDETYLNRGKKSIALDLKN